MKQSLKRNSLVALIATGFLMSGCLEVGGANEVGSKDLNNEDFSVVVDDPVDNSQGGGSGGGGQADHPEDITPVQPPPVESDGFEINKRAVLTASTSLTLDFYPPFFAGYTKITENGNCAGGSWEQFLDYKNHQSSLKNQKVTLSVQYRDYDGRVSDCYSRQIYIDQIGPEIVFAKYPSASVEEGSDVEIVFNVTDEGAGVADVTCKFAGISRTCGAGQNTVKIPSMASGSYTLLVSATDKLGHASQKSVSFIVSSLYKNLSQNVKVNEYNKVDILFVVDNSGSMSYEQKSMASRIRNFLDVVKGLDWQIGITTTDPSNSTYGDGRLVGLNGKAGSYILTSAMPDSQARTILGNTLQRSETGSATEQGIYASYRAIERAIANSGTNANFIRQDAQLAVVLISDEDESKNGVKNDPANFAKFIRDSFGGQKSMTFHSIISRPGDKACLSSHGFSAGFRYEEISKLTGGVIGDVCATDYASQVQGIAEGVRNTLKSFSLTCTPVIDNNHSLVIKKDGVVYTGTKVVQGLNVVFDQMLPTGNYEVLYSCLR